MGFVQQPAWRIYAGAVVIGGLFALATALQLVDSPLGERLVEIWRRADPEPEPRAEVLAAKRRRPHDPWLRDSGHVPLGIGLTETAKAYLEPGGALSPSVGSFGVSFWVHGPDGAVLRTSETMPIEETRSRFLPDGTGVEAATPDYAVAWTSPGPGRWEMTLTPHASLTVAIRSIGPAGGPITSIRQEGDALVIAERWRIEVEGLELAGLGVETDGLTASAPPQAAAVSDPEGWCYALLRLQPGAREARLRISDPAAHVPSAPVRDLIRSGAASRLEIDLPDPRFAESLDAQVAQILHGVVGDELRPGDPVHYALAWQRDAAVEIVALVRAGRADAARLLVQHLAEIDYFGGFGAETDAPGLALWAIAETARALDDPIFEASMAGHVRRKAEDILAFMAAEGEVRRDYAGSLSPVVADRDAHGVAYPSEDGLIHGRMDWHDPSLSLTAISLHGLEEAAALAERLDGGADAERWRAAASRLRQAWREHALGPDLDNERTLAAGLAPSFVAAGLPAYVEALDRAWKSARDETGGFRETPLWTYFDLAQARQWLVLGRPERAWATLEYFWDSSPHPGLYTLWESDHEEGGFKGWRTVRGWTEPKHVTPHYWASAEMILLQTAMLAYVDRTPGREALVLGAGVKPEWLDEPMGADGLVTEWGRVEWRWDPRLRRMRVWAPEHVPLRLGPAFPADALIARNPA